MNLIISLHSKYVRVSLSSGHCEVSDVSGIVCIPIARRCSLSVIESKDSSFLDTSGVYW